jgi:flagellar protein FlgJ
LNPSDFISLFLPGAQSAQTQYQVPAGFSIAQSAVETGWLKVTPPGNNLFGIKADPSWTGPTVTEVTHEWVHGNPVEEDDAFRAYPDFGASVIDHAQFLQANPRYAAAFNTTNSDQFAQAIAAAGYATAPNYAQLICEIIDAHNMTQYDAGAT